MEELCSYKTDGKISGIGKIEGEDQVNITFQVSSVGVEENFVITEAGVFAEDPDEGEILYGYLDMRDDPQLIYHSRNAISKMVEITMAIIVATADHIYAEINPGSLVSIGDFNKLKKEIQDQFASLTANLEAYIKARLDSLQKQIGNLDQLMTEKKCCLVDAVNEIAETVKPLIEYSIATDKDIDNVIEENHVDDVDWATTLDIAEDSDIDLVIAGGYEEEPGDESGTATNEDIDAVIDGSYVNEDEDEGELTEKEIDMIVKEAF